MGLSAPLMLCVERLIIVDSCEIMNLRTVIATRYVTPLREGGSLPAIIEADDDGMYVLKFSGAGQGSRALIAELVAGEIARAAGLLLSAAAILSAARALHLSELAQCRRRWMAVRVKVRRQMTPEPRF